jgi:small subunit ribosomal protein S6
VFHSQLFKFSSFFSIAEGTFVQQGTKKSKFYFAMCPLIRTFAPLLQKNAGAQITLLTNQTYIIDLMNQYETVFILTPVLSDVQMKEAADKFVNYLKEKGAEIISTENWGLKALAYPIQKKTSGFYQMVEFKAEPTVIAKLELQMRRDERVLRYLTVKNEKYAAAYAEKRRNKKEA